MAPKGRWGGKKEKAAEGDAAGSTVRPTLPMRESRIDLSEMDCTSILRENYFTIAECERYMKVLTDDIDWQRKEVTLAKVPGDNKTVVEPRMTLFMSDPGLCYAYSGRDNVGVEWHEVLLEIKAKAERAVAECGAGQITFNSVQMNRYNHPRHTLGLHMDNEPDLEKGAPIASVSFGAPREFVIQHGRKKSEVHKVYLADGSFFVMAGAMQEKYLHGVPEGASGLRFNLTFRKCIPRSGVNGTITGGGQELRKGDFERPKSHDLEKSLSDKLAGVKLEEQPQQDLRKVDPEDGEICTRMELFRKYRGQYSTEDLVQYWQSDCKPLPGG
mmetsp:Transcript_54231/g.129234  ORF Transcript_54231/g.129234 Transcript_54231/m.129234 type:complete len:328 (-) Transcript_54231:109-1092(-)|eukprot:CAMPEP_0178432170 /NCGR_PEP_ID=MMETSP0689_2-20121128/32243_1 /TAXON_ID=160604 /ORGANISM="Amphidinium massartii, Strain CS-259" /LENGTH=327 /DNA_ID=CAMNT_0020054141 /DNA_START=33 /DNA_END=1016 /DNA_ORIENTATION=+